MSFKNKIRALEKRIEELETIVALMGESISDRGYVDVTSWPINEDWRASYERATPIYWDGENWRIDA